VLDGHRAGLEAAISDLREEGENRVTPEVSRPPHQVGDGAEHPAEKTSWSSVKISELFSMRLREGFDNIELLSATHYNWHGPRSKRSNMNALRILARIMGKSQVL